MNSFDVNVGDKTYKLFYNRDSVRKYEEIGGTLSDLQEKVFSVTDKLFFCGLQKFHPNISFAESTQISDEAIDEFGVSEVFEGLVEPFMEVFSAGGKSSSKGRKFLATPKKAV